MSASGETEGPVSEPALETRSDQPYVGVRTVMPMRDFEREIPALVATVSSWLEARGLRPSGPPFLRYHAIDMPERMDVELGLPVDAAPDAGAGPVRNGVLPAGRYATLAYRGVTHAVAANRTLLAWVAAQGEAVVRHASAHGEVFEARVEAFRTDPADEPDPERRETQVAMKLRG